MSSKLKNKYSTQKVAKLIKKTDANKDGIITVSEALKTDSDNVFCLKDSDSAALNNLQQNIQKEQELDGIKGIEKALSAPDVIWNTIAKDCVVKHSKKEDLIKMFQLKSVEEYYINNISNKPEYVKKLKDLFSEVGITQTDICYI